MLIGLGCDKIVIKTGIARANDVWQSNYSETDPPSKETSRKVRFSRVRDLKYIDVEDRKGQWEQAATDRLEFEKRCKSLERLMIPVFSKKHRDKVYSEHFDRT